VFDPDRLLALATMTVEGNSRTQRASIDGASLRVSRGDEPHAFHLRLVRSRRRSLTRIHSYRRRWNRHRRCREASRHRKRAGVPATHKLIRLANRGDDPFRPPNFAYGLTIHTGDRWLAGTDANVTFTLSGSAGSSSMTVDTSYHGRMEQNDWNFVTMQSPDLGALHTIIVQRDKMKWSSVGAIPR
jgi:hypothetical protein